VNIAGAQARIRLVIVSQLKVFCFAFVGVAIVTLFLFIEILLLRNQNQFFLFQLHGFSLFVFLALNFRICAQKLAIWLCGVGGIGHFCIPRRRQKVINNLANLALHSVVLESF